MAACQTKPRSRTGELQPVRWCGPLTGGLTDPLRCWAADCLVLRRGLKTRHLSKQAQDALSESAQPCKSRLHLVYRMPHSRPWPNMVLLHPTAMWRSCNSWQHQLAFEAASLTPCIALAAAGSAASSSMLPVSGSMQLSTAMGMGDLDCCLPTAAPSWECVACWLVSVRVTCELLTKPPDTGAIRPRRDGGRHSCWPMPCGSPRTGLGDCALLLEWRRGRNHWLWSEPAGEKRDTVAEAACLSDSGMCRNWSHL